MQHVNSEASPPVQPEVNAVWRWTDHARERWSERVVKGHPSPRGKKRTGRMTTDQLAVWVTPGAVLLVKEMEMQVATSVYLVVTVLSHEQASRGSRRCRAFDPEPYARVLQREQEKVQIREVEKALQILRRVPFSERERTTYTCIWNAILGGVGSTAEVCYHVQAAECTVKNIVHQMAAEGLIEVDETSYPHFRVLSGVSVTA